MITVTTAKKIPHKSERHLDSSCWYRDCSGARPKSQHGRDERFHQRFFKQRGIVIPFVAIAMLALLGMAGLALDMGHLYENKTRLQNVVDAAALSAAKKLGETSGDQTAARIAAEDTIVLHNKGKDGNQEIDSIQRSQVNVTFFELVPGVCNGVGFANCFLRVSVNNLSRPNFLIQVLEGIGVTKTIAARAVSGPIAVNPCDVVPMMVCALNGDLDDAEDDGTFYGYDTGTTYCLKEGTPNEHGEVEGVAQCDVLGNGNFRLVDLESSHGASDLCVNMAGAYERCLFDEGEEDIDLKQGNNIGKVEAGLNTRFNMYPNGEQCEGVLNSTTSPPDEVVSYDPGTPGTTYTSWKTAATEVDYGVRGRRVVSVPVGQCDGAGHTADFLDAACFFLRYPVRKEGPNDAFPPKFAVVGEFTGERCLSKGRPTNNDLSGPYKMVLYKDSTSGDS